MSDIVYVDCDTTPAANYHGTRGPLGLGEVRRVERPPLRGHVHLRISDRCLHNDTGRPCPDPRR
jgi:hypothetical protein